MTLIDTITLTFSDKEPYVDKDENGRFIYGGEHAFEIWSVEHSVCIFHMRPVLPLKPMMWNKNSIEVIQKIDEKGRVIYLDFQGKEIKFWLERWGRSLSDEFF